MTISSVTSDYATSAEIFTAAVTLDGPNDCAEYGGCTVEYQIFCGGLIGIYPQGSLDSPVTLSARDCINPVGDVVDAVVFENDPPENDPAGGKVGTTDEYMLYWAGSLDLTTAEVNVERLIAQGDTGAYMLCAPLYPGENWSLCEGAIDPKSGWETIDNIAAAVGQGGLVSVLTGMPALDSHGDSDDPLWALVAAPSAKFAKELSRRGITSLEICVLASAAPGATHLQKSSESDETLACIAASEAPGSRAVKIARGLTAMRTVAGGAGVLVTAWVIWRLLEDTTGDSHHHQVDPSPGPSPFPDPDPTPVIPCATCYLPTQEVDLVTQRIATALPKLNPTITKTAAETCVEEEVLAGDDSYPCLTKPLFFPGYDALQAAEHDADVIATVPAWFRLTYESGPDKEKVDGVDRDWYGATRYKNQCDEERAKRGVECDEYPFYTTVEGGPGAYAVTTKAVAEVARDDNQKEGRALNRMQDDPACGMATVSGAGGKGKRPRLFPGSKTQAYIVIPMVLPVSDHLCGGVVAPPVGGGGAPIPS